MNQDQYLSSEMKAISLWQPWASAIAVGLKEYETRSWSTDYRGPLAIHAAKKPFNHDDFLGVDNEEGPDDWWWQVLLDDQRQRKELPLGAIVAVADLVAVVRTESVPRVFTLRDIRDAANEGRIVVSPREWSFGNWAPGRFAWRLAKVRALPEPIPCRGAQGLFNVEVAE